MKKSDAYRLVAQMCENNETRPGQGYHDKIASKILVVGEICEKNRLNKKSAWENVENAEHSSCTAEDTFVAEFFFIPSDPISTRSAALHCLPVHFIYEMIKTMRHPPWSVIVK